MYKLHVYIYIEISPLNTYSVLSDSVAYSFLEIAGDCKPSAVTRVFTVW